MHVAILIALITRPSYEEATILNTSLSMCILKYTILYILSTLIKAITQ